MTVALLALSLAMIVGGLFAMILGWDIVLLERGWSMVIAGSVSTSGGAILLGLVAVIARLARIQSELVGLRDRQHHADMPLPPSPVVDPVSLLSAGLLSGAGTGEENKDESSEPTLPLFSDDKKGATFSFGTLVDQDKEEENAAPESGPAEPTPSPRASAPATKSGMPEDGVGDGRDAHGFTESTRPDWARGAPDNEPATPEWARPRSEPPSEKKGPGGPGPSSAGTASRPTVIGTYNSGGNRYVMFSDGSIEAETPEGHFKFGSLDELKEFIAAGGESGAAT